MIIADEDIQRFWTKVNKTADCWLWIGTINKSGYGHFYASKATHRAHRVSYFIHNESLNNKLFVLHSCDNKLCVNPNHLREGTNQDNMIDRRDRNRYSQKGAINNNSMLTQEDVDNIRKEYSKELRNGVIIAKKYNVSYPHINAILNNRYWK